MDQPSVTPLPNGEVRVFEPAEGDRGRMYVLDVLGVSVTVYQKADGRQFVDVSNDAESAPPPGSEGLALAATVMHGDEVHYGEDEVTD